VNKKLENQISQLSESEQKVLSEYLEKQYCVEFIGDGKMLRDDISIKVTEILQAEFKWISHAEISESHNLQRDLTLDAVCITGFAELLAKEFNLEDIEFSNIMEWLTVKDIVDYLEEALECALHDMEDKQEPYINGFEPEA